MEKEINIAAILEGKPSAKLWSPIIGVCVLNHINSSYDINVTIGAGIYYNGSAIYSMTFNSRGKYGGEFKDNTIERECMLFPSKKMRDWSKFAWKKGDVLEYTEGEQPYYAIFEAFQDDEYTAFKSRYNFNGGNHWLQFNSQSSTNHFTKVSDEEAKAFIEKVEEHYGGKLNLSTLEIQKQPEFKDGDIVVLDETEDKFYAKCILILKAIDEENAEYSYYAFINTTDDCTRFNNKAFHEGKLRLATDSEKQQLFDALAKGNKAWGAEKKAIVDLPKKCEFKPKDWCLMRGGSEHINSDWTLCQFSHLMKCGMYRAIGGCAYNECIPYNDQTAHLLGTTDGYAEGGEE